MRIWRFGKSDSDGTGSPALIVSAATSQDEKPKDPVFASTALVPVPPPPGLAVLAVHDFTVSVLVYQGKNNPKEYGYAVNDEHFRHAKVSTNEEHYVPVIERGYSRRSAYIKEHDKSAFTSDYLHVAEYPWDDGLKALFLARAKHRKDYDAIHQHGVGNIYRGTLSFRVTVFNGAHFQNEANRRLDSRLDRLPAKARAEFNLLAAETCLALPAPENQRDVTYAIINSNGMLPNKVKVFPPSCCTERREELESLYHLLMSNNQLFAALDGNDNKNPTAYVCSFEKLGLVKEEIPAAFIHQLRREAIIAGLELDGERRRLYERERAFLETIQNRFPKLAYHGGADQGQETVMAEFVWMTLNEEKLSLTGTVVKGQYIGRALDDMTPTELNKLYEECSDSKTGDADSKGLLEAYFRAIKLDGWTDEMKDGPQAAATPDEEKMSFEEACGILKLDPKNKPFGKDDKEKRGAITSAFRQAIKEVGAHPDHVEQWEQEKDADYAARLADAGKKARKISKARSAVEEGCGLGGKK